MIYNENRWALSVHPMRLILAVIPVRGIVAAACDHDDRGLDGGRTLVDRSTIGAAVNCSDPMYPGDCEWRVGEFFRNLSVLTGDRLQAFIHPGRRELNATRKGPSFFCIA